MTDRQRAIHVLTIAREKAAADLIEQTINERHWLTVGEQRPWSEESVFDVGERLVKLNHMLAVLNTLSPETVEQAVNPLVSEIIA